jgi:hypothetical protein
MSAACRVRVRETRDVSRPVLVEGRVVRMCATGLYMHVTVPLCAGARVFMVVPLPSGAKVAARGYVTRLELHDAAQFGVAVRFTRTRLLPATP